jgi:hypothetical protein
MRRVICLVVVTTWTGCISPAPQPSRSASRIRWGVANCELLGNVEGLGRGGLFCAEPCRLDLANRTAALGGDTVLPAGGKRDERVQLAPVVPRMTRTVIRTEKRARLFLLGGSAPSGLESHRSRQTFVVIRPTEPRAPGRAPRGTPSGAAATPRARSASHGRGCRARSG